MNLDELETGVETDRLVVEAIGFDWEMVTTLEGSGVPVCSTGIAFAGTSVLHICEKGHLSNDSRPFYPSTDLNDAFWAAEKTGLFDQHVLMKTANENLYGICEAIVSGNDANALGLWKENLKAWADTPAMAICLAILKLKETTT